MTTATEPRYQMITFEAESQFGKEASQSIRAGMTWQEVAEQVSAAPEASIDYALASLPTVGRYNFTDAAGKVNSVTLTR